MALLTKIETPEYNCIQSEFYSLLALGWTSFGEHQPVFETSKSKYTNTLTGQMYVKIAAAHTLPSAQQRSDFLETIRVILEAKTDEALIKCQYVKTYIQEAYPKNEHKSKLSAAGWDFYTKAARHNWDYVENLLKHASEFITNNATVLQANNNMPAAFPAGFATFRSEWILAFGNFKVVEQDNEVKTNEKIKANNELFRETMSMFKDGQ